MSKQFSKVILSLLRIFLCLMISFLFLHIAYKATQQLDLLYRTVSLRYAQPLSGGQISNALQYTRSKKNTGKFFPSFWKENTVDLYALSSQKEAKDVAAISFHGNAEVCYGAVYVNGSAPGSGSTSECALSTLAAWTLWGSADIIGQTVEIMGEDETVANKYTICGIFEANTTFAIYGTTQEAEFPYVELQQTSWDNPRNDVEIFVQNSGLGDPKQIVFAPQISWLMHCIFWVPLLLALILFTRIFLQKISYMPRYVSVALGFVSLCVLAYVLSKGLEILPGWLVPNQWGSVTAWSAVLLTLQEAVKEWVALIPITKDTICKIQIGKAIFSILIASLGTFWLYLSIMHTFSNVKKTFSHSRK